MADMQPKKLTIDEKYVSRFRSTRQAYGALDVTLNQLTKSDAVQFDRPTNASQLALYADIVAYVTARAITGGYKLVPTTEIDAQRIESVLGTGYFKGNLREGYTFQRKAA